MDSAKVAAEEWELIETEPTDSDVEYATWRICFDDMAIQNCQKYCNWDGTVANVHKQCLMKWIEIKEDWKPRWELWGAWFNFVSKRITKFSWRNVIWSRAALWCVIFLPLVIVISTILTAMVNSGADAEYSVILFVFFTFILWCASLITIWQWRSIASSYSHFVYVLKPLE